MVGITHKISRFLQSLMGRLLISLLLVHMITLPFIFMGILYIVGLSSIDLFLDQTRANARMIADKLQVIDLGSDLQQIDQILDSAILSGQVVFAEIQVHDEIIRGSLSDEMGIGPFEEDLKFRQHGDWTYYMSLALTMGTPPNQAILRLGYDEQPTQDIIDLSRRRTVFLIAVYFFITTTLVILLIRGLVGAINQLRSGSRKVVSGKWNEHLIVSTAISDIQDLASDLEEMRRTLVEQSAIVKRTSRILHEQQQRLIESESMATVGEMAPVVAHNIRNPLASIRSSAELMYGENIDDCIMQLATEIMSEVDRLDGWLREFLLFSRSRDSDLRKSVNLCDLFRDSIKNFESALERKKVDVRFEITPPIAQSYGDSAMLKQMFNSLISNALDAMQNAGQITFSAAMNDQQYIDISIQDTGLGISEENIDKIYKPFHTSKKSGLGLGLLLVKRIVENHGGTIDISSELGVGTTIRFGFPSVSVARAKILVIEDDAAQALDIEKYLKKFNYFVTVTNSAAGAAKLMTNFKPDIILLELNIPGIETSELIMQLLTIQKDIKVIIISGHMRSGMIEDDWQSIDSLARANCVYGVLLKPLVFGDLKPIIDRVLSLDRPDREENKTG